MENKVKMKQEQKGDVLILRLTGRLDAVTSPLIEQQVGDLISEKDTFYLLMDFSGVSYLSSAGMRMLLATTKKIKAVGGKFILCNVADSVLHVLEMSEFDTVIELASDEAQALSMFK